MKLLQIKKFVYEDKEMTKYNLKEQLEIKRFLFEGDDEYDEIEEQIIERDEYYDVPVEEENYDGEYYDDGQYYDEQEYYDENQEYPQDEYYEENYEENYDENYENYDENYENYDENYDGYDNYEENYEQYDDGYDDPMQRVLNELSELKTGLSTSHAYQAPTPYVYTNNASQNNEAVMYNEISRLREELNKTQNAQAMQIELAKIREEFNREAQKREEQYKNEIRALNETINARNYASAHKAESAQTASSVDLHRLISLNEEILRACTSSDSRILAELDKMKRELHIPDDTKMLQKLDSIKKMLGSVHTADNSNIVDELNVFRQELKGVVFNAQTGSAPAGVVVSTEKNSEILRQIFEIRKSIGSTSPTETKRIAQYLEIYAELDKLNQSYGKGLKAELNALLAFEAKFKDIPEGDLSDVEREYNQTKQNLLLTGIDEANFPVLMSFNNEHGKKYFNNLTEKDVDRFLGLVHEINHAEIETSFDLLNDIIETKNFIQNNVYSELNSDIFNDIMSLNVEILSSADDVSRHEYTQELEEKLKALTTLHISDILVLSDFSRPKAQKPTASNAISDLLNDIKSEISKLQSAQFANTPKSEVSDTEVLLPEILIMHENLEKVDQKLDYAIDALENREPVQQQAYEPADNQEVLNEINELRADNLDTVNRLIEMSDLLRGDNLDTINRLMEITEITQQILAKQNEQPRVIFEKSTASAGDTTQHANTISSEDTATIINELMLLRDDFINLFNASDDKLAQSTDSLAEQIDRQLEDLRALTAQMTDDYRLECLTLAEEYKQENAQALEVARENALQTLEQVRQDTSALINDFKAQNDEKLELLRQEISLAIETMSNGEITTLSSNDSTSAQIEALRQDINTALSAIQQGEAPVFTQSDETALQIEALRQDINTALSAIQQGEAPVFTQSDETALQIEALRQDITSSIEALRQDEEQALTQNDELILQIEALKQEITSSIEALRQDEEQALSQNNEVILQIEALKHEITSSLEALNKDDSQTLSQNDEIILQIDMLRQDVTTALESVNQGDSEALTQNEEIILQIDLLRQEVISAIDSLKQEQAVSVTEDAPKIDLTSVIDELRTENIATLEAIKLENNEVLEIARQDSAVTLESVIQENALMLETLRQESNESLENARAQSIQAIEAIKEEINQNIERASLEGQMAVQALNAQIEELFKQTFEAFGQDSTLITETARQETLDLIEQLRQETATYIETLQQENTFTLEEFKQETLRLDELYKLENQASMELFLSETTQIKDEVLQVKEEALSLKTGIEEIKEDIERRFVEFGQNVAENKDSITSEVEHISLNSELILTELTTVKEQIDAQSLNTELKDDLTVIKGETEGIKSGISEIREDIERRFTEFTEGVDASKQTLENEVAHISLNSELLLTEITAVKEQSELQSANAELLLSEITTVKEQSELQSANAELLLSEIATVKEQSELQQANSELILSELTTVKEQSDAQQLNSELVLSEINTLKEQNDAQSANSELILAEIGAVKEQIELQSTNSELKDELISQLDQIRNEILLISDGMNLSEQIEALKTELSIIRELDEQKIEEIREQIQPFADDFAYIKEQLSPIEDEDFDSDSQQLILDELNEIKSQLNQDTQYDILSEVIALKESLQSQRLESISGIDQDIEAIKIELAQLRDTGNLEVLSQIQAFHDDFLIYREENEGRVSNEVASTDNGVLSEIAALREDLSEIREDIISKQIATSHDEEAIEEAVMAEISSLRDEFVVFTESLKNQPSEADVIINEQEQIERYNQLIDEISVLKDEVIAIKDNLTKRAQAQDAADGKITDDYSLVLGEMVSIKDELVTFKKEMRAFEEGTENSVVLSKVESVDNYLKELAQTEAVKQQANEELQNHIENFKAYQDETRVNNETIFSLINEFKQEIGSLKSDINQTQATAAQAVASQAQTIDNETVMNIVSEFRQEISSLREDLNKQQQQQALESQSNLNSQLTDLLIAMKDEIGSLKTEISELKSVDKQQQEQEKKDLFASLKDGFFSMTQGNVSENSGIASNADNSAQKEADDFKFNMILDDIHSLREEIASVKDTLSQKEEPAQSEDYGILFGEISSLRDSLNALLEKKDEALIENFDLLSEIKAVRDHVESKDSVASTQVNTNYDEVLLEISAIRHDLTALMDNRSDKEELLSEIKAVRDQFQAKEDISSEHRQESSAVLNEIALLRNEVVAIKEKDLAREQQHSTISDEYAVILGEIADLREDVQARDIDANNLILAEIDRLRQQIEERVSYSPDPVITSSLSVDEVKSIYNELYNLRSEISSIVSREASLDNNTIDSIVSKISDLKLEPKESVKEPDFVVLNEIAHLRNELARALGETRQDEEDSLIILDELGNLKQEIQSVMEAPDVGVLKEVLNLREEFQTMKEELSKVADYQQLNEQIVKIQSTLGVLEQELTVNKNELILNEIMDFKQEFVNLLVSFETLSSDLNEVKQSRQEILEQLAEKIGSVEIEELRNLLTQDIATIKEEVLKGAGSSDANKEILDQILELKAEFDAQREADEINLNFMAGLASMIERNQSAPVEQHREVRSDVSATQAQPIETENDVVKELQSIKEQLELEDNDSIAETLDDLRNELSQIAEYVSEGKVDTVVQPKPVVAREEQPKSDAPRRGRPRKEVVETASEPKKGRGRPRKELTPELDNQPKRGRGRPRKED